MEQLQINLSKLSSYFQAYQNCVSSNNTEWKDRWEDKIEDLLNRLPHGSGIDAGVKFDWEKSTIDKLVFTLDFHHMDVNGYYCGWTNHKLTATPTFAGFNLTLSGRNKNDIKDYLYQLFYDLFYVDPSEKEEPTAINA